MNDISIETSRERDDDVWEVTATATRAGVVGHGAGYSTEKAIERAKENLIKNEKKLAPVSPNFENTPESRMMRD
jgi:hypothetical protein